MELKLDGGKYAASVLGGLEKVSVQEETLQRVKMRLKARRGAFLPMSDYGSRLHTLGSLKPSAREAAAKQFVLEALADETEVAVKSVKYEDTGEMTGRVTVELSLYSGGDYSVSLGI